MDLSDFDKTVTIQPDQVVYQDSNGDTQTANATLITWKHNSLSVTDKTYYLREGHEKYDSKVLGRENLILEEWMVELGYDPLYYHVNYETKTIKEINKIEDQAQIDKWLKPNAVSELDPTAAEEI